MAKLQLTPEQIETLKKYRWELTLAMASGARTVAHGDKSVTFKTQAEMKEAIEEIDRQLNGTRKTRIIKTYAERGY